MRLESVPHLLGTLPVQASSGSIQPCHMQNSQHKIGTIWIRSCKMFSLLLQAAKQKQLIGIQAADAAAAMSMSDDKSSLQVVLQRLQHCQDVVSR